MGGGDWLDRTSREGFSIAGGAFTPIGRPTIPCVVERIVFRGGRSVVRLGAAAPTHREAARLSYDGRTAFTLSAGAGALHPEDGEAGSFSATLDDPGRRPRFLAGLGARPGGPADGGAKLAYPRMAVGGWDPRSRRFQLFELTADEWDARARGLRSPRPHGLARP